MKENVFAGLKAEFSPEELKWRVLRSGRKNGIWAVVAPYVDARAIMERLDAVLGPENWRDEYGSAGASIVCTLYIRVDGGEWVGKSDGTGELRGKDSGGGLSDADAIKGTLSDAFKRAAVKWGIGRYLYALETQFAQVYEDERQGRNRGELKDGTRFSWDPPVSGGGPRRPGRKEKPAFAEAPADRWENAAPAPETRRATRTEASAQVVPFYTSDDLLKKEILDIVREEPFGQEELLTAQHVLPKICSRSGLEAYKKQWLSEREKRLNGTRRYS